MAHLYDSFGLFLEREYSLAKFAKSIKKGNQKKLHMGPNDQGIRISKEVFLKPNSSFAFFANFARNNS
jgi:hypothetical protein